MEETSKHRILEENQDQSAEIFTKRPPFYKIDKYQTIYSESLPALNPLKIYNLMIFDNIDIGKLLEQQYKESQGDNFSAKVMRYYLDPPKEEIQKFRREVYLTFDEVGSQPLMRWRPSPKERKR